MSIYFLPPAPGLGDVIVALPVLQHLIDSGEPVYLVSRSQRQENFDEIIAGLAGILTEPEFKTRKLCDSDRVYNFRAHRLQRDYVWGGPEFDREFPGRCISDILEMIASDFGLTVDLLNLTPLPYKERPDIEGKTVLIPGTITNAKSWPASHWVKLVAGLKRLGEEVAIVGEPARDPVVQELIHEGLPWLGTPRLVHALQVVSSARAIITVDTGLMHLAVHQGVPTIALFGRSNTYLRPLPNCYPVQAASCDPGCLQTLCTITKTDDFFSSYGWNYSKFEECQLPDSQRCMAKISPETVLEQFRSLPLEKRPVLAAV